MAHLFELKKTAFVLWNPHNINPEPPTPVIGQFQAGNPPGLANRNEFPFKQQGDLWSIDAAKCGLGDGQVYHYWFEVSDSIPTRDGSRIACTDPTAYTVDWRLLAPKLPAPHNVDDQDPAAVVKFENGHLVPCDPGGETFDPAPKIALDRAAPNNRMVIYELPTSWARTNIHSDRKSAWAHSVMSSRSWMKAPMRQTLPVLQPYCRAGATSQNWESTPSNYSRSQIVL